MYASRFKSAAAWVLALSAVLALGACNKKVDDTGAPSSSAPVSSPGTSSGAMGSSSSDASKETAGAKPPATGSSSGSSY